MWELYQHAKAWKTRPSELLSIKGSYEAFCLDEAIWVFGSYVESELDKIKGKTEKQIANKKEAKLKTLLGAKEEQAFADPAALFS